MKKEDLGKVGLDFIIRHMTESQYSHEASWIYLRCNQLRRMGIDAEVIHDSIEEQATYKAWSRYDTVFIYHSMAAFPDMDKAFGSVAVKITDRKKSSQDRGAPPPVNVYDIGVDRSAWYFERIAWPQHEGVRYVSMDFPMIPYGTRCEYKAPRPGTSATWKAVDWKKVQARCDRTTDWCIDPFYTYGEGEYRMTMGDSHAHSVYQGDSMVLRRDGRTMHSINKKGLLLELTDAGFDLARIGPITSYYGNIDIRHHLCRQDDPAAATTQLLRDYEEMLKRTNKPIELVTPLPIEDESRIVPRMGWYKDTPFYGSRAARQEVLKRFIGELEEMSVRNGWDLFSWPKEWYEMDGIEFMQTFMERPRSVHLAWKFYRWNLIDDCLNTNHLNAIGIKSPTRAPKIIEPATKINLLEF